MARFRRFEVKREIQDGEKLRPDDNYKHNGGNSSFGQQQETEREANQVGGFDDEEIETLQDNTEIDENGNPIMPEGWTFLTHGSSLDRWDDSLLGNDFVVGNGIINGKEVKKRPLCCVERDDAKFHYSRSGMNTAKAYGGNQQSFAIRVLFYKNPRLGDGKIVRDKLKQAEMEDVTKYYMYQDGRHPAVPSGTKLIFLQNGDFDEITNTKGNNILWYIPEQYLEHYLEDLKKAKQISEYDKIPEEMISQQENDENDMITMTNEDVEQELSEFYTDDITNDYLEVYLAEKISQIYRDRLGDAGIFNVKKFLDGKLSNFQGVESYKAIIEELESVLELAENLREEDSQELEQSETYKQKNEEHNNGNPTYLKSKDQNMSGFHEEGEPKLEQREHTVQSSFDQILINADFAPNCVQCIKSTIKSVNPGKLVAMDTILSKTKEPTFTKGDIEDGNEQSTR